MAKINTVDDLNWHAIYTKPRNEKLVAERLNQQNIEAYCPVYTTIRQWSDRKKKVQLPLISSYVFVKCTEKDRLQVLQDFGVLNFVFWLGKPARIKEEEITALKRYTGDNLIEEISFKTFEPETWVEIQAGAFQGEAGKVIRQEKDKLTIVLASLGAMLEIKSAAVVAQHANTPQ